MCAAGHLVLVLCGRTGDVSVQHAVLGGNSDQQELVGQRACGASCRAQSSLRTWTGKNRGSLKKGTGLKAVV